jgi:hypothetical protein
VAHIGVGVAWAAADVAAFAVAEAGATAIAIAIAIAAAARTAGITVAFRVLIRRIPVGSGPGRRVAVRIEKYS